MTDLLEKAIARLPDHDQDAIAQLILDEMADEARWQERFDRSPDLLKELGDQAHANFIQGRTTPLVFKD